jgi:hypothetical protein
MKSYTDRAAELLLTPNCIPAQGQAFCPRNGLRRLGKSYTIGIANVKPDRAAEFLRHGAGYRI